MVGWEVAQCDDVTGTMVIWQAVGLGYYDLIHFHCHKEAGTHMPPVKFAEKAEDRKEQY